MTTAEAVNIGEIEYKPKTDNSVTFFAYPRRPGFKPLGEQGDQIRVVKPINEGSIVAQKCDSSMTHWKWNAMWCHAVESRHTADKVTHFAMQHDDVFPSPMWGTILLKELERVGADILGAVVPIKDSRGVSSTCVRNTRNGATRRITMKEIFDLPETFCLKDVQDLGIKACEWSRPEDEIMGINLGLWICRIKGAHWVQPPHFTGFRMQNMILKGEDGKLTPVTISEDWIFSEEAHRWGLKTYATRKVPLGHWDLPENADRIAANRVGEQCTPEQAAFRNQHGETELAKIVGKGTVSYFQGEKEIGREYRNDSVWGLWEKDLGDAVKPEGTSNELD